MAQASQVGIRFEFSRIPLISGARKYANLGAFPGGAADNRLYFGEQVQFAPDLDEKEQMLMFDPQTSGGLLLSVPAEQLEAFMARAYEVGQPAWAIGEVLHGPGSIEVIR